MRGQGEERAPFPRVTGIKGNKMVNKFKVRIPSGYLMVEEKGTLDEYPGVYVMYSKDGKTFDASQMVVCAEYDTGAGSILETTYVEGRDEPVNILDWETGRDKALEGPDVEPESVFIYKEYNDEAAYGEEVLLWFPTKREAEEHLRARVEKCYGKLEVLRKDPLYMEDTLEDDHVAIVNDGGDTSFFIVEEVKKAGPMVENEFSVKELQLIDMLRKAMMVIPGDYDLEMNHQEWHKDPSKNGWYALKYSEKEGAATPIYNTVYEDTPLITDAAVKHGNIDVDRVFAETHVYVSE